MQLQIPAGAAQWNDGREQRLVVSMLFATLIVAAMLSALRMPVAIDLAPVPELLVRLLRDPAVSVPDAPLPAEIQPENVHEEALDIPAAQGHAGADAAAGDVAPERDWEALGDAAVSKYLDGLENPASANPVLDAKRRAFGGRYQPPTHSGRKPIWENAEEDQLGRTVLRSGNCYKVIADPNVGSQWEFEHFGQYIAKCTYQKRLPRELPWVAEIRERYTYLKYPDGTVPDVGPVQERE